jgi:phosphotriesterase-related protein
MSIKELAGKIQTVLGTIAPDDLGVTLPHEHFLADFSVRFIEPEEASNKLLARKPVTELGRGWLQYHPMSNMDNLQILDVPVATSEGLRFKHFGGDSVVDVTNIGIGRDPLGLARVSRATGLNIIMGSGYYTEETCPQLKNLTEEKITEEIVRDITAGVGNTGVRAGIIGEIGTEWPIRDSEKMSLRAAAQAQRQTGAAINVHSGNSPDCPFQIIETLSNAGADISRVVISHVDSRIFDHDTEVRLAKTGCYLEYDTFSFESYYQRRMVLSEANPIKCDMPNDAGRINRIMALIEKGFLNQILISHDQSLKYRLWHYGGPGIAHILENVLPLMREKGMSEEHIHAILVENPGRLLQFI